MIIRNALVYTLDHGFIEKDVYIENGYFVEEKYYTGDRDEVLDAKGDYLIPGLLDIHFHGCAGHDFSDGTEEALEAIGRYELEHGITSICPASMTLPEDTLLRVCENASEYQNKVAEEMKSKDGQGDVSKQERHAPMRSRLCGIHLEGPFISKEKKGAQNPAYIKEPDAEMFCRLQVAAGGLLRLITIAPEIEGAQDFIKRLSQEVHISVGHTTSDYEMAYQAFMLGADHVTHFFNAMPGFTHRAPGVVGAAFDAKHVMPELICDGIHVDASAVRVMFQLFGAERMILISDSMRATGMADGEYTLGGLPVTVRGNLATLSDGTIAGSATNLMDCMRMAVSMGIPLEVAVRSATYNPAKSIGVADVCGSIDCGKYGDCVIIAKEDLAIRQVILGGEVEEK